MRYVRLRGPNGVENGRIDGGHVVTKGGTRIELLDPVTVALAEPYELLAPVNAPEVWCAGVTYERSRDARIEESTVKDVYSLVYDAERPELFLKDAACRRTVGPGEPIGIRADSAWNVPEPEIGLVLGEGGAIAGKEGNPMAAAYSASKAAVIALTKSIGKDLAGTGVLVNCIAPAVIETPILQGLSEEHIGYMVERIPLGRMGTAGEVAALVCWLASEDCSFSTGATFDISGGRAVF